MEPEKKYDPQEQITVTMTREQWNTVQGWLDYGACYNGAKQQEYLTNDWMSPTEYRTKAATFAMLAEKIKCIMQIVEAALYPPPEPPTDE